MPKLNVHAEDKKTGMTLAELSEFVALAYAQGHPGTTPVAATVGFRGQLQQTGTK